MSRHRGKNHKRRHKNFSKAKERFHVRKLTLEDYLETRQNGLIDLGEGHYLSPVYNMFHRLIGYEEIHDCKDGHNLGTGFIPLVEGYNKVGPWKVTSKVGEPITMTPSVVCTTCTAHGIIRNGEWKECGAAIEWPMPSKNSRINDGIHGFNRDYTPNPTVRKRIEEWWNREIFLSYGRDSIGGNNG